MADEIQNGDTVMLKSGGPVMTVIRVSGSDITCSWFIKGEEKREAFRKQSLEKVNPYDYT